MSTDCQTVKTVTTFRESGQMEGLSYFITGAANGIGLEYTKMALRAGGRVVMTDINRDMGEERLAELREQYGSDKVMFAVLNVTDEDQWGKVRLSYSITGMLT